MSNRSRTLYTGVTNNVQRRVGQHKAKAIPGFTCRYNITRLVYVEEYREVMQALAREKQIKGWLRAKKAALIESTNPNWRDLADGTPDGDPSLRAPAGRSAQDDTLRAGAPPAPEGVILSEARLRPAGEAKDLSPRAGSPVSAAAMPHYPVPPRQESAHVSPET